MTLLPDAVPARGVAVRTPGRRPVAGAPSRSRSTRPGAAGDRTYTYLVPDALADLEPGEAVLVEFGRRQALGIVLAEASELPGVDAKPIVDRVRADGPLLPPLALRAGAAGSPSTTWRRRRSSSGRCCRPGLLERLELVAELTGRDRADASAPDGAPPTPADRGPRSSQLDARPAPGPRPGRPDGRAGLLRRLRALEADGPGRASTGRCWAAGAGPRYERWIRLRRRPGGRGGARGRGAGRRPAARTAPGRGPRRARGGADRRAAGGRTSPPATAIDGAGRPRPARPRRGRGPRAAAPAARQPSRRACAAAGPPRATSLARPGRGGRRGSRPRSTAARPAPLLLDGVTGGGKTAIYVEAIAASLEAGRPALVLVPEIALALPLVDRLRADLDARVALVHSGLGDGERADEWRRIRAGDVDIVVGTRLAVLAPLADVGLIIVDEEHDAAYKSDRTPRLQARDVGDPAGRAGRRGGRPRLGDARGRERRAGHATGDLRPGRPAGAPGRRGARRSRSSTCARSWRPATAACCRARWRAPSRRSTRPPASRRSSSSTGAARRRSSCAATAATSRPARTASGRSSTTRPGRRCAATTAAGRRRSRRAARPAARRGSATSAAARSGSSARSATRSPACASGASTATSSSAGARRSGSSTPSPTAGSTSSSARASSTKGLDIPSVTLVGVVSSDVALNLPDERAAERTYQLLVQAIGRAGRGERPGRAILQTYQPEHPAIVAVATGDRTAFYDAELDLRERFGSPPFGRLVKLTVGLADRDAAEREAEAMAERLREPSRGTGSRGDRRRPGAGLHRPAGRPLALERRPARRRPGGAARRRASMRPWSVDVDPESLL